MKSSSLVLVLLLFSCSQKVARPMGDKEGFSVVQISDDTFEIAVQGGYGVSGQLIGKYFLCKSAELAIENDAQYFMILRSERDKSKGIDILDQTADQSMESDGTAYDGAIKYSKTGIIKILAEIPAEGEYYNAQLISRKITPKIQKGLRNENKVTAFRTIFQIVNVFSKTI